MGGTRHAEPQKAELSIPMRLVHPAWDAITAQSVHKREDSGEKKEKWS